MSLKFTFVDSSDTTGGGDPLRGRLLDAGWEIKSGIGAVFFGLSTTEFNY